MRNSGMFNMMKLDWLGMRKYRYSLIVAPVMACGMGIVFGAGLIIPYLVWGMFTASLYCFDAEEKGHLNQLYLTLPISRGTLISARYVMSLILQLIGIVAGIAITLVVSSLMYGRTILNTHTFSPSAEPLVLIICAGLLFCAFMSLTIHPILHKFGYAKAKIFGYVLPIFAAASLIVIFVLIANRFEVVGNFKHSTLKWMIENTVSTSVIILGLTALLIVASYALSLKVYAKRDF